MFNADAGRQASTQKIDQLTNRFAAEFEDRMMDLSMSEQEALVERLVEVMSGLDTARGFATNSAGQPAAQLGSGPSAPPSEQEALDVLFNSPALSDGVKNALRRILNPRDPQVIAVENDGTPSELASTRTQRDRMESERDDARSRLAEEQDANRNGSLAHRLAAAQAAAATPADAVTKATMLPLVEAIEQAASQLDTHMMSSHIDNIDELNAKVAAAKTAVS